MNYGTSSKKTQREKEELPPSVNLSSGSAQVEIPGELHGSISGRSSFLTE